MKSSCEQTVSSGHKGSIDSLNRVPGSICSEPGQNETKFSRTSSWSGFLVPSFAIFEACSDSKGFEKEERRTTSYAWTAAVKRVMSVSSMWRIQERVLGLNKTGNTNSTSDIWILGVCYNICQDGPSADSVHTDGFAAFVEDFSSRIFMTYRFPSIGDSKYTSDVKWGCMLRSSQMLVAQALLFQRFGRSWRKPLYKPLDKDYIEILHLFGDSDRSAFSIHNLLEAGKAYALAPGSWVGPYAMSRTWETLVRCKVQETEPEKQSLPMAVYVVSGDEYGGRGGAPVVCVEDVFACCFEFSRGQVNWTPLLLLIPLVLGLDKVNPRYIPLLGSTFTFPQSLGIIGGRPGASTYIVGVQDHKAFYLDPHEVHPVVDVRRDNLEADTSSYHCNIVRHVSLDSIDSSLAIGFYCRNKDDFDDFCLRASELADHSNGAPLFTVTKTRNLKISASKRDTLTDGNREDDLPKSDTQEDDWQLL